MVALEVLEETCHIHKHERTFITVEIVLNFVVSPELTIIKLSVALGTLGLPRHDLLFLSIGLMLLQA